MIYAFVCCPRIISEKNLTFAAMCSRACSRSFAQRAMNALRQSSLCIGIASTLFLLFHFHLAASQTTASSLIGNALMAFDAGFHLIILWTSATLVFFPVNTPNLDFLGQAYVTLSAVVWVVNMTLTLMVPWGSTHVVLLYHLLFHDLLQASFLFSSIPLNNHPILWFCVSSKGISEKPHIYHLVGVVCMLVMATYHIGLILINGHPQ